MSNTEHLTEWEINIHANNPDETGCIKKHASTYSLKKYPRCNYRKNAHEYSKANETHIYNIPNMRSPQRWVDVWKTELDFSPTKAGGIHKNSKAVSPDNEGWYLDKGKNFTTDKIPFWHNTHHCISCGEILENFEFDEWSLIIATGWNINEKENAMILPKAVCCRKNAQATYSRSSRW